MNITTGTIVSAQKVVVYGPEGVGKTSFAAQFPDPLFIDTEGGTKQIDVKRANPSPTSWGMLLGYVREVSANPALCATLVIDTADWAEQLCVSHVCAKHDVKGIEDFAWGKGFTYVKEEFGRLLNLLQDVIERGVNVVVCAHSQIKKFEQPDEMGAYDRYELKLSKQTAPLVKEWCDMLLFATYKTIVTVQDNSKGKAQGNRRVMRTSHAAAWDAKNRCSLPDEMDLDYSKIAHAIPVLSATPAQASCTPPETAQAPTPPATAIRDPKPATPPTQSIVYNQDGSVASNTADPAAGDAVLPSFTETEPAYLKPLRDLMTTDKINDAQLRDACGAKGWCTPETAISVYPADFVAYLVSAWHDEVIPTVESRKPYTDQIPF